VDALVIFGAPGDLAKLGTFPALVGLVDRGVLDVPVVGVAKSGWGLDQFRDYAAVSLRLNGMDPDSRSQRAMAGLLRYVDGDLDEEATYILMSQKIGSGTRALFYLEVPPVLFGRIVRRISGDGRADGAWVWSRSRSGRICRRAAAQSRPRRQHPDHHGGGVRRRRARRRSGAVAQGQLQGHRGGRSRRARTGSTASAAHERLKDGMPAYPLATSWHETRSQ
jgi:Glucose-6-phosphate dehydrogenase, NAD binding domain